MRVAAFARQCDLFLALAKTGFALFGVFIHAVVACHTFFEFRPVAVGGQDRAAACAAQLVRPLGQPVPNRDTFVENKTFALPGAFFGGHVFKLFQHAPLEVEHIFNPLPQQVVS